MNPNPPRREAVHATTARPPVTRPALGAIVLSALLAACGAPADTTPPPAGPPAAGTITLGGLVLPPGGTSLQSLSVNAQSSWHAPRARGEVLILGTAGQVSAQNVTALSGVRTQRIAPDVTLAVTPPGLSDEAFATQLESAGLTVQPNYRYEPLAIPNDPAYPAATRAGVPINGKNYKQRNLDVINILGAWEYLATKNVTSAVKVAVLDTGINRNHEDFAGANILPGFDFCSSLDENDNCAGTDSDPSEVTSGDIGHGTSSAGIIAAGTNNGIGISGITWSGRGQGMLASILPVKVFAGSVATTASIVQGLNYAREQGARVINMSLGLEGDNVDPALFGAIGRAAAADIVMIAAAGNKPNVGLYYPASDPRVLAVGALGSGEGLSCFSARPSSRQKALDLVAPGGVAGGNNAQGGDCYRSSEADIVTLARTGYTLRAGTSEAAPQVAGVAALIRAYQPTLSAPQVKAILRNSATPTTSTPALRILNAERAVRLAETPPVVNLYDVTVEALNASNVRVNLASITVESGTTGIPYLMNVPAGTYTLRATIRGNGLTASGARQNVTITQRNLNVDIPTTRQ